MYDAVTFINPFPYYAEGINEATIEPPLGIAYLAAYARQEGFQSGVIDANVLRLCPEDIAKQIFRQNTDVIGISANIVTHRAAIETIGLLRKKGYKGIIICGGPYPTSLPEVYFSESLIDCVVAGEGELSLIELLRNLRQGKVEPFKGVCGTIWKHDNKLVKEKNRELIADIDGLPSPAYDLLPDLSLYRSRAKRKPVGAVLSSRGCPHQCIYCNRNIFQHKFRPHSVTRVLKDVDLLVRNFGVRQIDFLDDNILIHPQRAKELFLRLKPYGLAINLQNGIYADNCDEELLRLMKDAGVFKISIGVETGNPEMQIKIKKRVNLEKVIKITKTAKRLGIVVYGNFILGFPYETKEMMESTIQFALKMDPDVANFMLLVPLPGTEVYKEISHNGRFFFEEKDGLAAGFYSPEIFFDLPGMETSEVKACYISAYRRFYLRIGKITQLILRNRSFSEMKWLIDAAWVTFKPMLWQKINKVQRN